jgi:dipeptidyl aminopeptidase/acylaminoacyl peptidase
MGLARPARPRRAPVPGTLTASALGLIPGVALMITAALPGPLAAQQRAVEMDPDRARLLYVSNDPAEHSLGRDYAQDMERKAAIDALYDSVTAGVADHRKIVYPSRADGMEIPAYLFQPLERRGTSGHAALIWVHGGVHGTWTANYWPFVLEALERGYVVIAPEYRGSWGYGQAHHDAIDYGGHEVEDAASAYHWMVENLPHVDPERVAIMGWSHGGYISLLAVSRGEHPFQAAVGIVPVSNLIFRLSFKGPSYQHHFSTQEALRGLPFEHPEEYVRRSPVYQVDSIQVPVLVHLADNDEDVNFEEAEMLVHALQVKKPELAETRIYRDPPGGHAFSRQVDMETLSRMDTPEQRDSWSRVWTFLDWNLRPYDDANSSPLEN